MLSFYSYHKDFYERLCWVWALVKENRQIKKITKLFTKGNYAVLIFDNYRYYTGSIISISGKGKRKIELRCPINLLDLRGPIHWKKRGDDFLKKIKAFGKSDDDDNICGIIILDLRQLRRIVSSKDILYSFVRLAYNGVIYVDLPTRVWLVLRGYGIIKGIRSLRIMGK